MNEFWVIGDIHGCYYEFIELLSKLPNKDKIYITGDLVDRGLNSNKVVQHCMENKNLSVCKGNHEAMLLNAIRGLDADLWIMNGGMQCVESYGGNVCMSFSGVRSIELNIPKKHIDYLKSLPNYYEIDGVFISHTLDINDHWYRGQNNIKDEEFHIFGHTPLEEPFITKKVANIDTGCVFGGKLTAIHYPSLKIISVNKIK